MALTYSTLLRQIAMTCNALVGAVPATLQSTYATVPLTAADFDSSVFPFGFLKDKMINSQEGLIMAIANTDNHPFRASLISQTASLAYGVLIPEANSAGAKIVGMYGAVRDATSFEPCTLNDVESIRSRHLNPGSMFKLAVYQYAIVDKRIYHTRTNVIIDVCAYTRPVSDSLTLTDNILLPDVLGPAIVQGAIAECFRDDQYIPQAQAAGSLYGAWIAAIKGGLSNVEPQSNPTPDAQKAYA